MTVEPLINALVQYGPMGVVLAWFLFRTENRLGGIERALDRVSRAQMLDLVSRPETPPAVRRQAERLLKEVEVAQAKQSGATP